MMLIMNKLSLFANKIELKKKLFRTVEVKSLDSEYYGDHFIEARERDVSGYADLCVQCKYMNQWLVDHYYSLPYASTNSGVFLTLDVLHSFNADKDKMRMVLLLASIYQHNAYFYSEIYEDACEILGANLSLWNGNQKHTLPVFLNDKGFNEFRKISRFEMTDDDFLQHCVDYVNVMLEKIDFVETVIVEHDTPVYFEFLGLVEESEKKAEARRKEDAEKKRQEKEHFEKMRQEHPRWGEWKNVTPEELQVLVLNNSAVSVGKMFGVSGNAVGDKCEKLGLKKPGRGDATRVKTGHANNLEFAIDNRDNIVSYRQKRLERSISHQKKLAGKRR